MAAAAAWRALATRLCVRVPARQRVAEDAPPPPPPEEETAAAAVVPEEKLKSPSVSLRRLSSSGSRNSKSLCAICLGGMRAGHGQALFTAECSHRFHFHCISSSVGHGNHGCPVCRSQWKELPFHGAHPAGRARVSPVSWPQDGDAQMAVVRRLSRRCSGNLVDPLPEAADVFDDDELGYLRSGAAVEHDGSADLVEVEAYPELQEVGRSVELKVFDVLIHVRAPRSASSRAPVDLVAVLDVSGSMGGAKLALVKRAMSFVVGALGPDDRLSVVAFSSAARRLFPLSRMSLAGRRRALQAVGSVAAAGGTNIADGLKKAAKVVDGRRLRNPVCSIVLLSDGRDTRARPSQSALVPPSILAGTGRRVQIHAFGFGADHDPAAMHAIAEASGGTFSFVDAEGSIRDAIAQCVGGLLSVVVKEMKLGVECVDEGVLLTSIKSGSYGSQVAGDGRSCSVDVGELYADEERGFLITLRVPAAAQGPETMLVRPSCSYQCATSTEIVRLQPAAVSVRRPEHCVGCQTSSPEVERERHRVRATEDMSAARAAAEGGAFVEASLILEARRRILEPLAASSSDGGQFLALVTELREMQERVESRRRYDESGRAFMLAGLSSHSWQRATARGDSTELTTLIHTYQTPSMVDMLHRSHALLPSAAGTLDRSTPSSSSSSSSQSSSWPL